LGLTGGITSSARVGSGALQLIEDSSREDDYYSTTVSGLAPNTTYKISASLYVRSFKGGAVANRGLYGIARASGTYDGSTQTSANITSATSGWVVRTIRIKTGASDNQLELRLYAPRGTTDWDAVTVTDLAR